MQLITQTISCVVDVCHYTWLILALIVQDKQIVAARALVLAPWRNERQKSSLKANQRP